MEILFVFWHWLVFAVVLLILEVMTGGGFLLWVGISALVVGFIIWIFPGLSSPWQLLLFAIGSISSSVAWWTYLQSKPMQTDQPRLNRCV